MIKGGVIALRNRILESLAGLPEIIVSEKTHDRRDVQTFSPADINESIV